MLFLYFFYNIFVYTLEYTLNLFEGSNCYKP